MRYKVPEGLEFNPQKEARVGAKSDWLIGVPTKYGEVALLPSYVADFGYGENVLTRDNVVVTFVRVKHWDNPTTELCSTCESLYKMPFSQFDEVWRRRMQTDFGKAWDLVEMIIVDKVDADGGFEVI